MNKARAMTACLAASLLVAGCGNSSGQAGSAGGDAFSFAIKSDPGLLDPAQVQNTTTYTALSLAYDTLVNIGSDGRIVSGLAKKWDVKPSSVTFTLRPGVTCTDGSPVTASTIAANVEHITDPATKSPAYGVVIPEGLKAKADDRAGTVTLSTPKPFAFILQSTRYLFMVCGKGLKDRALLKNGTSGSGPFQLTSAHPNQSYTYTRRTGYTWGPGGATASDPAMPDSVVLRVIGSESTEANLLLSHQLNAAQFAGPDRARVTKVPGITTTDRPNGTQEFFFHQGTGHPGHDPAVRKALLQAVDLDALGAIATGGTGKRPTGLVMPPRPCPGDTVTGHLPIYDPRAAEAALEAAGWHRSGDGVRRKNGKKLTLRMIYGTSGGETMAAAAEYLADAWKKAGADVRLRALSDAAYGEVETVTQDWDVDWAPLGVTLPTQLLGALSGPFTPDGGNFAHLTNKTYEDLTTHATKLPGAAGCAKWARSESALFDSGDLIPVIDKTLTTATYNATFRIDAGLFDPTSIRMTGGDQ
ncbi:ABC transporter substrate-binding protein [Streptomyces sp. SID8366]|uniref:ABC transporter substrate-binding protein n=1 Tax=unclassified Streptomyces TaxID=2593676 RepID=UPI000DB9DE1B|nr:MULTISPECIES: ABC transporter substrate-binding protein [unclassified Streptomyces]MYU06003.1 ABC transporter substrate-binding protein [Streptomyces sp. SID8366]MYU64350.1 ABC transporter substrate-binding protein [Streptomyces sp. SID69]RAJ64062.1 peptide/nickel transport system substrate-binding protein [Streptomyces sp. PsTaAH-130]